MPENWSERLEEALEPLASDFAEGDDGDVIVDAFDSALSVIEELPGGRALSPVRRKGDPHQMLAFLRAAAVANDDLRSVKRLFMIARKSEYGDGLTDDDADTTNELAPFFADLIRALAKKLARARSTRAATKRESGKS